MHAHRHRGVSRLASTPRRVIYHIQSGKESSIVSPPACRRGNSAQSAAASGREVTGGGWCGGAPGRCSSPQLFAWGLHQGVLFGTPFPDTRFIPIGTVEIPDQQWQRFLVACRSQPAGGIDKADPVNVHLLPLRRLGHHEADQVVDQCKDDEPPRAASPRAAPAVQAVRAQSPVLSVRCGASRRPAGGIQRSPAAGAGRAGRPQARASAGRVAWGGRTQSVAKAV